MKGCRTSKDESKSKYDQKNGRPPGGGKGGKSCKYNKAAMKVLDRLQREEEGSSGGRRLGPGEDGRRITGGEQDVHDVFHGEEEEVPGGCGCVTFSRRGQEGRAWWLWMC